MGLKWIFGGRDDAVSVYRRELQEAVRNGNVEQLRELLDKPIEAPPAVLDDVLGRTLRNKQLKMAELVLKKGGARTVDSGTMRQIVYDENKDLFRLMTDYGWDFNSYVPPENGAGYVSRLRYLRKDYDYDRLMRDYQAAQQEIAALRKAQGLPEKPPQNGGEDASDTPPGSRNFSL